MKEFLEWLTSGKVILSIVLAALTVVVFVLFRRWMKYWKRTHKEAGGRTTVMHVCSSLGQFLILFIGALTVLQINGINIGAIAATLGIAGAAVGLALQDCLRDIVMGINILTSHFFSVGECVEFNGREGVIVEMDLRTTKIGDLDDHSITTVCNRNIGQIRRLADRLDIDIPLSYKEDPVIVDRAVREICSRIAQLESVTECRYEGRQSFEASAILYRIRLFCDPSTRADVRRAAHKCIQDGLQKANISIPFNQLDVHCDIRQ